MFNNDVFASSIVFFVSSCYHVSGVRGCIRLLLSNSSTPPMYHYIKITFIYGKVN